MRTATALTENPRRADFPLGANPHHRGPATVARTLLSACPQSPHLAPLVIQILDTLSYNKSINTMNFNRAALRPLSRGPQPECGERTNSLGIKILPITPFRSRFWREFPAKILIPIDRGGEGGGGYPKAGRKQENPRNTRSAHNSLRNKDFTSNPFKLKDLARLTSKSLIPIDRGVGGVRRPSACHATSVAADRQDRSAWNRHSRVHICSCAPYADHSSPALESLRERKHSRRS